MKLAFASFLAIVFVPTFSLFAFDSSLPTIIPVDELLTPIQLVDGVVSYVTVPDTEESLSLSSSSLPCEDLQTFQEETKKVISIDANLFRENSSLSPGTISAARRSSATILKGGKEVFRLETSGDSMESRKAEISKGLIIFSGLSLQNERTLGQFSLNSIANLSPVAFLGICLNPSELPSKNLPMRCGSFLSKSMIQKFAKDSISLWQPARTTFPWPRSINCLPTRSPSIQEQFLSHIHSMSDILFTWLKETEGSRVNPELVLGMGTKKAILAPNLIV